MPFQALGLDGRILHAIRDAGYTEPTPIQAEAIPPILEGRDLIGIAQTGTGKTAAFTLPILSRLASASDREALRGTRVLVLAPTRELVVQVQENVAVYAKHSGLRAGMIYGGVGERPQIALLKHGIEIVVSTPGRLIDLASRGFAHFEKLEVLVLDEADRMLDMGFLPDIRRIIRMLPARRQTLMFSATLSREIEALTTEFLREPKLVQIGRRSNPAETVAQWVVETTKDAKPGLLLHLLQDPAMDSVLVFTRTKFGADRVAKMLERAGLTTGTLHSNRSQSQRLRALKAFKAGEVRVLVATDIAARGIDVDGISHVVNYDFPAHPEDYVHRIGRTGRAHAVGDAISFATPEDRSALRSLERFIGRGLLRKNTEGFDPKAALPGGGEPRDERRRHDPRTGPRREARGGSGGEGRIEFRPRRDEGRGDARREGGPGGTSGPRRDDRRGQDDRRGRGSVAGGAKKEWRPGGAGKPSGKPSGERASRPEGRAGERSGSGKPKSGFWSRFRKQGGPRG